MNQKLFKQMYEDQLCEKAKFVDYKQIINDSNMRNDKITNYVVAMEELAELSQQVAKYARGKGDRYHLLEELADVLICVDKICRQEEITRSQLITAIEVKSMIMEKEKK